MRPLTRRQKKPLFEGLFTRQYIAVRVNKIHRVKLCCQAKIEWRQETGGAKWSIQSADEKDADDVRVFPGTDELFTSSEQIRRHPGPGSDLHRLNDSVIAEGVGVAFF